MFFRALRPSIRRFSATRGHLDLQAAIKDQALVIVDVTSSEEWKDATTSGIVPKGAIHIPISDLPSRAKELGQDKTVPLLFYCKHGVRAGMAATYAQRNGFINAFAATDAVAVSALLQTFRK
jgi:rhodanese-related sulfurtransferase